MTSTPEDSTCESKGPSQPVVIITNEYMSKRRKEGIERDAKAAPEADIFVSPLSFESVHGYLTDITPKHNGASEIKEVTDCLRAAGILCCLVGEAALMYYGARRVLHDWKICVPSQQFEDAVSALTAKTDLLRPFESSAMTYPGSIDHHFPRFKFVGLRLFFVILPSHACHLQVEPKTVESSATGLPYPALPTYAQSLLDTSNEVDLDDLIDGMDLTLEWGEKNLLLDGTVDADWIWWKTKLAFDYPDDGDREKPAWYSNPDKTRDIWRQKVSIEAKKERQGWKLQPGRTTRFRWACSQPQNW